MTQLIHAPTYTSGSLLDVLIVSDPNLVIKAGSRACHFSPHKFDFAAMCFPKCKPKPTVVECRSLKRVNRTAFIDCLRRVDWQDMYREPTAAGQWLCFLGTFTPILTLHIPVKRVTIRNPTPPPISDSTRDLMCQRRAARSAGGHTEEYRALNRAVRSAVRRDAREDISRRLAEDGPQSVYRNVRQYIGTSKSARVSPTVDVDSLNEYFVGVGPRVASEVAERGVVPDDFICRLPRVGSCRFNVSTVDLDTLYHTIHGMKNTSACGTDGICIRVLKLGFDAIGVRY